MKITIDTPQFDTHPEGKGFLGIIKSVEDLGVQSTQFGEKHKIQVNIVTQEVNQAGEYMGLSAWYTLSAGRRANLTILRESLAGRQLELKELADFDTDAEMIGRPVQFDVEHKEGREGRVFANITDLKAYWGDDTTLAPIVAQIAANDPQDVPF